jgi:hypothetical protein
MVPLIPLSSRSLAEMRLPRMRNAYSCEQDVRVVSPAKVGGGMAACQSVMPASGRRSALVLVAAVRTS